MRCKGCNVQHTDEEASGVCPDFENEAMVPLTYDQAFNSHTWVMEEASDA